jgi:hypothetical protein
MADFNVRSDSVDVEQIMRQIRARIREKRGADYTEAELQQLATVKLERFLDPRGLRSDLVEQFRRHHTVSPELPKYEFEDTSLYETHRGPLRALRRLLNPLLKLFINPNAISHALHLQVRMNDDFHRRLRQREETDPLVYEVIHNLVVEITRLGIEVQNLKMRVEPARFRRAPRALARKRRSVQAAFGTAGSVGFAGSPRFTRSARSASCARSAGSARGDRFGRDDRVRWTGRTGRGRRASSPAAAPAQAAGTDDGRPDGARSRTGRQSGTGISG